MSSYAARSADSRTATVFPIPGDHTGRWRVRFNLYPENSQPGSGWYGGRVLWNSHTAACTRELAEAAALRWRTEGLLPDDAATPLPARRVEPPTYLSAA